MSRDRVPRRCRRLLKRLSQPSSAAGLAALLALLVPQFAEHAPAIVDLVLTAIAIGAAVVAMVKCECRDCNGR
jgi:multisubunit Na+/H+ antiporter MnhC subunit